MISFTHTYSSVAHGAKFQDLLNVYMSTSQIALEELAQIVSTRSNLVRMRLVRNRHHRLLVCACIMFLHQQPEPTIDLQSKEIQFGIELNMALSAFCLDEDVLLLPNTPHQQRHRSATNGRPAYYQEMVQVDVGACTMLEIPHALLQ